MAVFSFVGASLFGAGTFLATLTAGALQTAAGIGLSMIAKAISGQSEGSKFGVQVRLQGGDDVPRSILLGYASTAGSLVYANSWGNPDSLPNAYFTQVIALADYPIRALVGVDVNGIPGTLGTEAEGNLGFPVLEYRKDGRDHVWVKFYDGNQTAADPFLVSRVSSAARPWEATRVGRGIPYVMVTCLAPERQDGEEKPLFTGGLPRFKFSVHGARLFDPTDPTHVWENPATWGGDGDFLPAVQIYNLMRGIRFNGVWLYGLQSLPAARLPLSWWQYQIGKCRAEIEGPDGPEPTYRTGGEIQVGAQIKTALEAILTGCQGRLSEVGGSYKLHLGAPDAAVRAFDDSAILSTEEQSFTPFLGLEDTINGIQATYPNPAEGWNTKTAPPLLRTDLEALDGNRRLMASVSLDMVPYTGQVQRLMLSALLEAQRARRHTFVMPPEYWDLEPGDYVEWTSARNGYETKMFRVDGVGDQPDLNVLLDVTEVDPADYDWDQDTDFRPVIEGPLELVETPPVPMVGWQVYGVAIKDELGRDRRPGIEAWYQPGLPGIQYVRIQVRLPGAAQPFIDVLTNYGTPFRTQVAGNFPPNTDYEVRGIYVPLDPNATAAWSEWLAVRTPDVKLSPGLDFDPYSGVVGFESLGDDLAGWLDWIGQTPRELIEAIQDNATKLADQEFANSDTFRQIRREMAVSVGEVSATFEETITLTLIPLEGQVVALADALTQLTAGDGTDVSTARFRMTALSGPSGYSRIGAETRVDTADPGAWRGAAWYLDTPVNPALPTRFLVRADQFIVVNSADAGAQAPFIFDGTALRVGNALVKTASIGDAEITNAKIGNLQVDTIKLANGAVTALLSTTGPDGSITSNGNTPVSADIAITFPNYQSGPIILSAQVRFPSQNIGLGTSPTFSISLLRNGAALRRKNAPVTTGGSAITIGELGDGVMDIQYIDAPPAPGSYTYTMRLTFTANGANVNYFDRRLIGSYAMK